MNPLESDLNAVLEAVGKEKNLDKNMLIEALEAAMLSAARKKLGLEADLEARYSEEIGEVEVYEFRQIVEGDAGHSQISFEDALKMDPELTKDAVGEDLGVKLDTKEFGRVAAQNAKQIIIQRVRDAERIQIYSEYKDRKGELVTGVVRRFERGNVIVDLGRAEAVLTTKEQVPKENIRTGDRVIAYVLDVLEMSRGSQILLSRTHPHFVVKLFEQEVPEIQDGIVTIEAAAREAGFRTKIAVKSRDSDVDPVGACVGMRGARVQAVVQEMRSEKIDIVPYDEDDARFLCNALAPAEVSRVLVNEGKHSMMIVVPDDQLSLAIGRRGQNVRLAAELCGWKIDIQSETKVNEERDISYNSLVQIEGLSELQIQTLYHNGFKGSADMVSSSLERLASILGFEEESEAAPFQEKAKEVVKLEAVAKIEGRKHDRVEAAMLLKIWDKLESAEADFALTKLASMSAVLAERCAHQGYDDVVDIYLDIATPHLAAQLLVSPERAVALRYEASMIVRSQVSEDAELAEEALEEEGIEKVKAEIEKESEDQKALELEKESAEIEKEQSE